MLRLDSVLLMRRPYIPFSHQKMTLDVYTILLKRNACLKRFVYNKKKELKLRKCIKYNN